MRYIAIIFTLIINCNGYHQNHNNESNIKPKVNSSINKKNMFGNDSLIILTFEGGFQNDSIKVYKDNNLILDTIINTDNTIGLAFEKKIIFPKVDIKLEYNKKSYILRSKEIGDNKYIFINKNNIDTLKIELSKNQNLYK